MCVISWLFLESFLMICNSVCNVCPGHFPSYPILQLPQPCLQVVWLKADLTRSIWGFKSLGSTVPSSPPPLNPLLQPLLSLDFSLEFSPLLGLEALLFLLNMAPLFIFFNSSLLRHLSQEQRREEYAWIHHPLHPIGAWTFSSVILQKYLNAQRSSAF